VILEANQVPSESLATFIHQGLIKLKIETAYEASVYGRITGELFPTWSQQFELKPRPTNDFVSNFTPTQPPATEYSLIWRMLDLLGFPGLALYLILGKTAV